MGCNSSYQAVSNINPLAHSRRNRTLSKLPEKHRFNLKKQNSPHGTTSNTKITDLIVKNKEVSSSDFKKEYGRARELNQKFSDLTFATTEQSLGGSYKLVVAWKSPEELVEGDLELIGENIAIKQNKGVNNYFLSAMSIIVNYPDIIKRIFQNEEVSTTGIYGIWLCVDGWKCITVDDRVPVDSDNKPYFSSSGNVICVPLIQKALAKSLKSYQKIQTGLLGPLITCLTGCPYQYLNKSSKIKQSVDQVWDFICKQLQQQYIVAVSNQLNDRNQNLWFKSQYSYQILETTILTIKGDQERLLKVANPFQKYDWTGRWSLKSKTWTTDLKSKLQYNDQESYFWINIQDLSENFKQVCSCRYKKQNIYSFCRLQFNEDKSNEFKGVFLTVDTKNKGYLTLTQKDHRLFDKNYKYALVRLIICEISKESGLLTKYVTDYLDATRDLSVELELQMGSYYIGIECQWFDRSRELVVSFYGSHGVVLMEDDDLPKNIDNFINQMIILQEKVTEKERKHIYVGDQNISRTTGTLAGYIYYHYSNDSKVGKYLQETVLLKQREYIKVLGQPKEDEFEIRVDAGEDVIVKFKVLPQGNGFYSYSTKIQFYIVESYSLDKLKELCQKNPTKTKKREIDGKSIEIIVKTFSYSGGIALLYLNKMDKYAFVEELTVEMDNLILQNEVLNDKSAIDIELEPHSFKLLSFLIDKPGEKVSFKTNMSFYLNTPQFQF